MKTEVETVASNRGCVDKEHTDCRIISMLRPTPRGGIFGTDQANRCTIGILGQV